jgi:tight adherence protein C
MNIDPMYAPGIIALLGALTVICALYAIYTPVKALKRDSIKDEFFGGNTTTATTGEGIGKYARPLLNNFLPQFPAPEMSAERKDKVAEFILKAGNPWKLNPEEYSAMKWIFASIGFFIGLVISVLNLVPFIPWYAFLGLFTLVGFAIPYSTYNSKKEARTHEAQKELPEALDLLVVTLTAGEPFESAIRQVVTQLPKGLIKDELGKVDLKIRAGNSLESALTTFSSEIDAEEVESFTKSIIQAQKLGADVTETLQQQAMFVRENHEARVEKMIARLSTLMFIPLAATMLPAFIIIFLLPSIQQISSMI